MDMKNKKAHSNKDNKNDNLPFVKSLNFRSNRGSRIKNLLEKDEDSEIDDFWKNNKYFGDIKELEKDDDDYVGESDVPDIFDEDFDYITEEDDNDEEKSEDFDNRQRKTRKSTNLKEKIYDEMEEKIKKTKKQKIDSIINNKKKPKQNISAIKATGVGKKEKKSIKHNIKENIGNLDKKNFRKPRYIHNFFTQEQLLREAPHTEYLNKKSLEDLVRLECDKKIVNFNKRKRIEGPKITWKTSIRNHEFKSIIQLENRDAYKAFLGFMRNTPKDIPKKNDSIIINLQKTDNGFELINENQEFHTTINSENTLNSKNLIQSNLLQKKLSKIAKLQEEENKLDFSHIFLKSLLDKKRANLYWLNSLTAE